MTHNHTRGDKSEAQFRKTGRSGNHAASQNRGFYAGGVKGGGSAAPSPAVNSVPSSSSRSYNKKSGYNNGQGAAQPFKGPAVGVRQPESNATVPLGLQVVQNGVAHVQPRSLADRHVTNAAKQIDTPAAKVVRAVPITKQAQSSSVIPEGFTPATPPKDASFFQFGTINPGFMNGVQVPARTTSAPPKLDEQNRDQVRNEPYKAVTHAPIPAPPKPPQQRKKDAAGVDQPIPVERYPPTAVSNSQALFHSGVSTVQKPAAVPMAATSVHMPFSAHSVPVQFTPPSAPIQAPGIPPNTLQMPMHMPIGNPQLQAQYFVPGLQPHYSLQAQSMVHQGQGIGYPPQMGHQLPPQMGNMGMGIGSQYVPQPGNYNAPLARKSTVKITHPDTHEELKLDKRTDSQDCGHTGKRFSSNLPAHSQPHPTVSYTPSQSINSYGSLQPNSYSSALYSHSSVTPTNPQMNNLASVTRLNYAVAQGVQTGPPFVKPSAQISVPISMSGPSVHNNAENARVPSHGSAPAASTHVTVKPPISLHSDKANFPIVVSAPQNRVEASKSFKSSADSISAQQPRELDGLYNSEFPKRLGTDETASVTNITDGCKTLRSSDSTKDQQKGISEVKLPHPPGLADETDHGLNLKSPLNTEECINITDDISDELVIKDVSEPLVFSSYTAAVPSKKAAEETENHLGNIGKSENVSSRIHNGGDGSNEMSKAPVLEKMIESEFKGSFSSEIGARNDSSASENQADLTKSELDVDIVTLSADLSTLEIKEDVTGGSNSFQEVDSLVDAEGLTDCVEQKSAFSVTNSSGDAIVKNDELSTYKPLTEHAETQDLYVKETSDPEAGKKPDSMDIDKTSGGSSTISVSGSNVKVPVEQSRPKSSAGKKKKKKELLMKADAAGTTFDLYNAYKGPEEKLLEMVSATSELADNSSGTLDLNPNSLEGNLNTLVEGDGDTLNKDEVDNWEDAEISTPTLNERKGRNRVNSDKHLDGVGKRKYSRDFLLILKEQFLELPAGFEIAPDIADTLMSGKVGTAHSYPSTARIIDRPPGSSRNDRRGGGMPDDDKWNKSQASLTTVREGNGPNFRPGQGAIHGVLRNPRSGGILVGPVQSLTSQGSLSRNNSDSDRWQRGTGLQKGLMPSPQSSNSRMHKSDNRYQINKSVDEEEGKQRKLKGILNKLTPQNFEKLFEQVKEVNIDNAATLTGVISQIFDKALTEPTFCEMYANFCHHLSGALPDFGDADEKINFRRLLLNECQEEFERGEREEAEAKKIEEGELQLSEQEREEKRLKARRRMLGNIRLIGELYKKKMLTERIMHSCIQKLLGEDGSGQYQNPDEEDVEALCKLMGTIGEMIDHPKAKDHMDAYFDLMLRLSGNQQLSSRVRFMLKDSIDLRKNRWQQRRKVEGPKKIDEVHRDAAQERQLQASRLSRGSSMGSSSRRGPPPMDYGPRSSALPSLGSQQIGGPRNYPAPSRGIGTQDVRFEERQHFESRTLSMPQRPTDDDSIMLGPQGGLGRGMSIRGQLSSASNAPSNDVLAGNSDLRRYGPGPNGYGHGPDWQLHRAPEEALSRPTADRFMTQPAPGTIRDRNPVVLERRDSRNWDRPVDRPTGANTISERALSEDELRDKSVSTIREYYSARKEDEVRLCVKELKSPGFYPDMVSIWVLDSFERKNNVDRELLAKLLVNLCNPHDCLISSKQLISGFESVLSSLEDTITDSPKATEYLGRIFGKIIMEDVLPFREVGRLLHVGGYEPGSLRTVGLASDVIVSAADLIKREKGEPALRDILGSSDLRLEDFRPQDSRIKSQRLEALISLKGQ